MIEINVKEGDRIRCLNMVDDPNPIESGEEGVVYNVDRLGHIYVNWDNGRKLSLIHGTDEYEVISSDINENRKIKDWKSFNK